MSEKSVEQELRDILQRMGIKKAQEFTAGELCELANYATGINESPARKAELVRKELQANPSKYGQVSRGYNLNDQEYVAVSVIFFTGKFLKRKK